MGNKYISAKASIAWIRVNSVIFPMNVFTLHNFLRLGLIPRRNKYRKNIAEYDRASLEVPRLNFSCEAEMETINGN